MCKDPIALFNIAVVCPPCLRAHAKGRDRISLRFGLEQVLNRCIQYTQQELEEARMPSSKL